MMADLDFEQIDKGAIKYMREHLDPSLIKEYDDDEIFLYIMDLCDEYSAGLDEDSDEESYLDLDAMADFVSHRLAEEMSVKLHEDDAYDIITTLYDYYAEVGLVDVLDAEDEE